MSKTLKENLNTWLLMGSVLLICATYQPASSGRTFFMFNFQTGGPASSGPSAEKRVSSITMFFPMASTVWNREPSPELLVLSQPTC